MGILYLVRHAQASFLEPNYDKLSALGETQSRLLGEYWAQRQIAFDRVGVGPCARQKDTVKLVSAAYRKSGLNFPEPQTLAEFDEYHAEDVLRKALPGLLEKDQEIRDLHAAFQAATNNTAQRAAFQRLFEAVIGDWVRGVITCRRRRDLAGILRPGKFRPRKVPLHRKTWRKGSNFHLRRPHRGRHAARSASLARNHATNDLDVAQLILERISLQRRALHAE